MQLNFDRMSIPVLIGTALMAFFVFIGVLSVVSAFSGLIVMLLWNWLIPDIYGGPQISWLQGWGIAMLTSILFKGSTSSSK